MPVEKYSKRLAELTPGNSGKISLVVSFVVVVVGGGGGVCPVGWF